MAINTTIKIIQDIMRKDAGVDGDAQRIGQLSWMIFLKILDDREQEYESFDRTYCSPIPSRLRWRSWAANPWGPTGDELVTFVNNDLFKNLKNLPATTEAHSLGSVICSVFEDAHNYMKSGILIRQVVNKINEEIRFKNISDRHLFGDIYEQILRDLQSAGNAGEYYTPRAVTEFMVSMLDPKIGEKVLDPACGTGGFLVCSIEHIRSQHVKTRSDEMILQQSIFGVEKKPFPHLLCTTNMMLHGIEVPSQIRHDNTLLRPLYDYCPEDQVDVIITNPPFGGQEEDGVDSNFHENFRSKETADLFLLLIMRLLKDGGRAAVVLPDGFLFGEGVKTRIKEKLLEECNLHTIIRLPKGVFNPYTDIATNILFFIKGTPTRDTWYYTHPYPPNYKSYSKKKPIRIEDFEQEKQWWTNREENKYAWKVSFEEIKANGYNLDIKNPHRATYFHGDVNALLDLYRQSLESVMQIRGELKQQLMIPLENWKDTEQDTFFTNFDLSTQTSSGVQKLRELVLHLAMQGRLVPQNSTDEPASTLYRRIKNLETSLIKNEVIRHPRPLLPIQPAKVPFQIPKTWKWVRLGEIAQIIGGGTPDTNRSEYFSDHGIPWLTPADLYQLKGKFIGRGKRDLSDLGLQKSSARLLPKGTVLFSSRAPIGYVAIAANELATNQGFKSCVPYIMGMNEFIFYFLTFAGKDIERNASGTTFKEVSGKVVQQVLFPLPPLAEQLCIVSRIDQLMALFDKFEAKCQSLNTTRDELVESLMHQTLSIIATKPSTTVDTSHIVVVDELMQLHSC